MVAAIESDDDALLMTLTGQDDGAPKSDLSKLSINYETETDDGKTLKKGDWRVWYEGRFVYAPEVALRVFWRTFAWSLWDAEEGQPVSSSVQKPTLKGDFPDSVGGNKCGRLAKEEVETLSEDDPRLITSKAVACNQVLYGVVTGKMKDADGNEVQVDELPVIGYFKKSGFMPMNNFINGLTRQKKIMQKIWINLKTNKMKKGSVTFFVPVPTEGSPVKLLSDTDKELVKSFKDAISATNAKVMKQYKEALKATVSGDADLAKDFDVNAA